MELRYQQLPPDIQQAILRDKASGELGSGAFPDEAALRRDSTKDKHTLLRPSFVRDCEKILHLPVYNRYSDKTQVFSFYENDDLSRRGLHVQLVSRIARNIGRLLGLNLDLIEAIALGHDLGHTPFGHAGERYLDELLNRHTGRRFFHNVHSVRVLDVLYRRNVSLQVLDGILCHNGEFEQQEYRPASHRTFEELDQMMEGCYTKGEEGVKHLIPATLEGCVVRISDMIAYLGKDRQDAVTAGILTDMSGFSSKEIGTDNSAIINNLVVDVVTHSYGKGYIMLSPGVYGDLKKAKEENYQTIYRSKKVDEGYGQVVEAMFGQLYGRLLDHLHTGNTKSPIFAHHIRHLQQHSGYYDKQFDYLQQDPHQIVVDYLASMTDRYFMATYALLFPDEPLPAYQSYFQDL